MPNVGENDIERDVSYVFSVLQPYLEWFPVEKIAESNICELGPGKNLGVSLAYKCFGAENVYVVDKYPRPWHEDYHKPLYLALAQALLQRFPDANPEPLLRAARSGEEIPGVIVCDDDAEHLRDIPDSSIDFCCSWAVLEHLYNPPQAIKRLSEIAKDGSVAVHQVDFRDHYDFSKPLEFLLYDFRWDSPLTDETYTTIASRMNLTEKAARDRGIDSNGLIRRSCGYTGNSYRSAEYGQLFPEYGFDIIEFKCNMYAEAEYLDSFMPRLHASGSMANRFSRQELSVISGKYVLKKKD